jgi:hypothetical protein
MASIKALSSNPSTTKRKYKCCQTPVIHAYNPSTWEYLVVSGQPRQKLHETLSQGKKAGLGVIHLSSQLWLEALNRRIQVHVSVNKK